MTTETNTAPEKCPACDAEPKEISHDGPNGSPGHIEFLCGASWHAGAGWYHPCHAAFEIVIELRASHAALVDLLQRTRKFVAYWNAGDQTHLAEIDAALAAGGTTDAGRGLQPAAGEL